MLHPHPIRKLCNKTSLGSREEAGGQRGGMPVGAHGAVAIDVKLPERRLQLYLLSARQQVVVE